MRNFKPFFLFFAVFLFLVLHKCLTHPFVTCLLFCEFFIALIAEEPFSALFPCTIKKTHLVFIVFLLNLFLNVVSIPYFFYGIWGGLGFISCSSCLIKSMVIFGYESFFVEKYDKKWRKLELFFLIFFFAVFRVFFLFFETSLLDYYDLSIVLRASGCPIGWKEFFFGFICFCNIKKFTNFFQFFSASRF